MGITNTMAAQLERTYIMIKPDGVQRGLVGTIIARFEAKGYKLSALKMATPGKTHMEKHYEDLKAKKFFPGLIEYMTSGPVICMSGQAWTQSSLAVRCSVPLSLPTPIRALFEATSASMSAGTSAMGPMLSSLLRPRSPCGSQRG